MLHDITKRFQVSLILILYFASCTTFIYFKINEKIRSEKANLSVVDAGSTNNIEINNELTITSQEEFLKKHKEEQHIENINFNISNELLDNKFHELDEYARTASIEYEKNIEELTKFLIIPTKTEIEKIRVLFVWIAFHVKYDTDAFNSGNYSNISAENVLHCKKTVCEGYSNLLKAMCKEAGLKAECITGYAKGYGYKVGQKFSKTNHVWNAIKINNNWALFDVTWASGFGINQRGKMVAKLEFEPYWFNVQPNEFIFTHLPMEPSWQLTNYSINIDKFEKLPFLNESFFKLGFNSDSIYNKAIIENVRNFVETYTLKIPVKIIDAPYYRYLNNIDTFHFDLISDLAKDIVLKDGNQLIYFFKNNNRFTLAHKPKGKYLEIMVKLKDSDKHFSLMSRYKILNRRN